MQTRKNNWRINDVLLKKKKQKKTNQTDKQQQQQQKHSKKTVYDGEGMEQDSDGGRMKFEADNFLNVWAQANFSVNTKVR